MSSPTHSKPNTSPEVTTKPPPPAAFTQLRSGCWWCLRLDHRSPIFDLVKVRLQTTGKGTIAREGLHAQKGSNLFVDTGVFTPLLEVTPIFPPPFRQLYDEGDVRSGFWGSLATLARDGPGSAAYFATYEIVKGQLTLEGKDLSLGAIMTAGGLARVAIWVLIFPVDRVKIILQSGDGKLDLGGVVKQVYTTRGIKAFFPGLGPALARTTFLGLELAYKAMDKVF
ncbi:mitochondrial carrier domain-containing protein [Terfezia claveryi]|nr:mitochondrial carrier domain-containing protein [Terfezia claveryi]